MEKSGERRRLSATLQQPLAITRSACPLESEWREPFLRVSDALPRDEPNPAPGRLLRLVRDSYEEAR